MAEGGERTRIVLIDDHEFFMVGLKTSLAQELDFEVSGMATTGEEGLKLVKEKKPHVAVVDYNLPKMSGVAVCEEITRRYKSTSVIILTSYLNDEIIRRALDAGAKAYLYKDIRARQLKAAIRSVEAGNSVLDSMITGKVVTWSRRKQPVGAVVGSKALSIREIETLRLVALGASNIEIASALNVSRNTAKTYVHRTLDKLGCKSRTEAAAMAAKLGLL